MGKLTRMARAAFSAARSTSLENPQVPLNFPAEWLLDMFNGGKTDSGMRVSEMTALQVGTLYACVNIISGAFAALPLGVYERVQSKERVGKKKANDNYLFDILRHEPNEEMTTFTFLKTLMCHGLLWGNAYAEIQRDNSARPVALWPRNPARTKAIRTLRAMSLEGTIFPAGTLMYETTENINGSDPATTDPNGIMGRTRIVLAEDMIHVPGLSLDGRVGQSIVYLARQMIGLSLATEKYGAKFFGNGARPAGILTIPNAMDDVAVENLRKSWAEAHGGENQFKVAVLEAGVTFNKIAATPNEGQMLETRDYQKAEICSVFNVPLHMVAGKNDSGKSTVEQSSIEFVSYCLHPWITAWEMELERKLFHKIGRSANVYFPHFDRRHLLYPDADARGKYYASGRQWGYLNKNDIREFEDLNPDESAAGEIYTVQINMQNDKALIPGGASDGAKPPAPVVNTPGIPTKLGSKGTQSAKAGKGKPAKKRSATDLAPLFDHLDEALAAFGESDYAATLADEIRQDFADAEEATA